MSRLNLTVHRACALALTLTFALVALADPVAAQRNQWERIASKKVNMLADRDVIELDRRDGRFNALRFNAIKGNINIYRIRVTFGNGEKQDLDVNKRIREGETTGPIDLRGKARVIDRIEMLYASSNLLKRAQLDVFGRVRPGTRQRATDGRNDDFKPKTVVDRSELAGWEKLGQRNVDLDFSEDRIWIGLKDGRFDKLVFRAKGGNMRLRDIKVVYRNGQVNDIRVRSVVRDGELSKALDLEGRHRGIRRVELTYRRGNRGADPILLEVFALPAINIPSVPEPDDDEELGDKNWHVLASRDVDLSRDRDEIRISGVAGVVQAVALRARGNGLFIYDIRVTYGNGRRQTFRVDERLRPGRQSKAFDLKGNGRRITKVELLYEKARNRGRRATVEVLGRKVDRRAGGSDNLTDEEGFLKSSPLPRGWESVGSRILDRDSKDGIIGPAGEVERFSEIVFRVTGAPIRIRTATIRFKNGRAMRLRINGRFQDGDKTDPISFKGRARRIEEIELDYDRIRGRDKAMVEVIGRQAER